MSEVIVYSCDKCMGPSMPVMNPSGVFTYHYLCAKHADIPALEAKGYSTKLIHPRCPPLFRATDPSRMPEKIQTASLNWVPTDDKPSIIIHGLTGTCKTRAAWMIVNRLWGRAKVENKRCSIRFFTMRELSDAVTSSYNDDIGHKAFMDSIISADLVILDDLGKERMTPRLASDLFAIVDERGSAMKTTIITTNFNGSTLSSRFEDPEMGVALVRRVRDYFYGVGA